MINVSNVKPLSYKEMKAVVGASMIFEGQCCSFGGMLGGYEVWNCDHALRCTQYSGCPAGYRCNI